MMKCISCTAEIPANWSHALNNNLCPSCGGPIMDEDSKSLLDELREAMKKMPNDPEGLSGWLLSNYRLIKIGSAEPTDFYKKNQGKKSNLKINENPVEKLLRRANDGKKMTKQSDLADLARKIQNGEIDGDAQYEQDDAELEPQADVEYDDEGEEYKPVKKISSIIAAQSASLVDPNVVPLDAESMRQAIAGVNSIGGDGGTSAEEILNVQRMANLKRQQELQSMGSVGKIKRSE